MDTRHPDPQDGQKGVETRAEITPEEAAEELLRRRRSRESLLSFTEYTHPAWKSGMHHRVVCQYLEAVERGDIDRLMIFAPPRHSKSELANRRFPAWYLGRHPDHQIITCSYGGELATDIGADVRDILHDRYFHNVFPNTTLRADASAAGRWRTEQGGIYIAAGVGGPIVGRGFNIGIIDDPFKSREEADSARIREVVWKWYVGTFLTRQMPGGAIVLMCTRWHEDDLAARMLKTEKWEVLELPAIKNEGTPQEEALWPEWFPLESLHRTKEVMAKGGRLREWKAQYQQRPTAEEGTYCKREWFTRRYKERPENLAIYIASDFAVTPSGEGRDPDFTEHGVFGMSADNELYVLDWWSGQTSPDEWIKSLIFLVRKWKPMAWFGEAGVIRRSVQPLLERLCEEERCFFRQEWISSTKDKATRGRAFQGWASMGRVLWPENQTWAERVMEQCIAFPTGDHDDAFDAMSIICLAIDEARPGVIRLSENESKKRVDGYRKIVQFPQSEWKVL